MGAAGSSWADAISVDTILAEWTQTADWHSDVHYLPWQKDNDGNLWSGQNNAGSIVSDFASTAAGYSFSASLMADGDPDMMGIVFGFQDRHHTYALSWGGSGIGLEGIHVSKEFNDVRTDLASFSATRVAWTWYDFSVTQSGSQFSVSIDQGGTNIFSYTFMDTTFATGSVGFATRSQGMFIGANSIDYSPVPEPTTMLLLGTGLIGLAGMRRKMKK